MLFVATHSYSPLSAGLKLVIVRVPSFTSVFPTGKSIPDLVQFITGGGKPNAWQVCRKVESSFGVASDGGVEVRIGRPNKRKFKSEKFAKKDNNNKKTISPNRTANQFSVMLHLLNI